MLVTRPWGMLRWLSVKDGPSSQGWCNFETVTKWIIAHRRRTRLPWCQLGRKFRRGLRGVLRG